MLVRALILVLFALAPTALGSFCGESTIPFSVEILPNGHPVLGCARPSCFGWDFFGRPINVSSASFHLDGFVRQESPLTTPQPFNLSVAKYFRQQTAKCAAGFDNQCPFEDQWLGGIEPLASPNENPFMLRCCDYNGLELSEDQGIAVVKAGQVVYGGEVFHEGRQFAFDYVANIRRRTKKWSTWTSDEDLHDSLQRVPKYAVPESTMRSNFSVGNGAEREFLAGLSDNTVHMGYSTVSSRIKPPAQKSAKRKLINTTNLEAHDLEHIGEELRSLEEQYAADQATAIFPTVDNQTMAVQPIIHSFNQQKRTNTTPAVSDRYLPDSAQNVPGLVKKRKNCTKKNGGGGFAARSKRQQEVFVPAGQVYTVGGEEECPAENSPGYMSTYYNPGAMFYCFSADTRLRMATGEVRRMDQLRVLSSDGVQLAFSRVESWIHRLPEVQADFIRLELEGGRALKLTGRHFIYRVNCSESTSGRVLPPVPQMVYAEQIRTGDCLLAQNSFDDFELSDYRVVSVSTVREGGIYAPLTGTGDILVEGILASCFTDEHNQLLQNGAFARRRQIPIFNALFGHYSSAVGEGQERVGNFCKFYFSTVRPTFPRGSGYYFNT